MLSEILNHPRLQQYARTCPAGCVIMTEGDQADDLYILIEGRLDVVKGGRKIHEINRPGAFFGELSFLLDTVRIASVINVSDETRYLCLPNAEVNWAWQQFPEFSWHLARNLAKRLSETTKVAQGFREFCDQMPDALIMTDKAYAVLSWNTAAEKLYGRTWEQMRGKSVADIYDKQAAFTQFMATLNSTGSIREKMLKINHPEKEWFFVSTSTTIIKDPQDNIHGYLFLGRDATSLHRLEKKQQHVKRWLLPLLLGLALLTGWLGWQQFSLPQPTGGQTADNRPYERLIERFAQDGATLGLALRPALESGNPETASLVLADYFIDFHPELVGITGILVLANANEIFSGYLPKQPDHKKLVGQTYQGTEFSKDIFLDSKKMNIYMVSRPESAGGQGVEVAIALRRPPVWLAFRLDMDFITQKYHCDISDLAEAINRRNQEYLSGQGQPIKNAV
jgi:PAS domain S-box-containing protein